MTDKPPPETSQLNDSQRSELKGLISEALGEFAAAAKTTPPDPAPARTQPPAAGEAGGWFRDLFGGPPR
jgi:hypothetical protein